MGSNDPPAPSPPPTPRRGVRHQAGRSLPGRLSSLHPPLRTRSDASLSIAAQPTLVDGRAMLELVRVLAANQLDGLDGVTTRSRPGWQGQQVAWVVC